MCVIYLYLSEVGILANNVVGMQRRVVDWYWILMLQIKL